MRQTTYRKMYRAGEHGYKHAVTIFESNVYLARIKYIVMSSRRRSIVPRTGHYQQGLRGGPTKNTLSRTCLLREREREREREEEEERIGFCVVRRHARISHRLWRFKSFESHCSAIQNLSTRFFNFFGIIFTRFHFPLKFINTHFSDFVRRHDNINSLILLLSRNFIYNC